MGPENGSFHTLHNPIGVFDSGVGGLTVLRALRRRLPGRDFVYVGDTARVPYGRKPPEMVAEFARGITEFLCGMGVEGVVVACNTASSAALPALARETPVPVWGVIEPGVEAAGRATRSGRVGVIGTKGTIASRAYQRRLEALGLSVWAQACPMLVHVVEEGLADSPEAHILARHYLAGAEGIDTLILGCTHYPLLRPVLQEVAGPGITLVDSAEAIADAVAERMDPVTGNGRIIHYVTGDPVAFEHTARTVGNVEGSIVPLPIARLARKLNPLPSLAPHSDTLRIP